MVDDQNTRYDMEFARRWVVMCCALDLTMTSFLKKTGYKQKRVNHYQKGAKPPRDVILEIGAALKIKRLWSWLLDEDPAVFDDLDKPKVQYFQQLPEHELRKRANELGWWKPHGAPRKPQAEKPRK